MRRLTFSLSKSYVTIFSRSVAFREGAAILGGNSISCHGYFYSEAKINSKRERKDQLDMRLHFSDMPQFLGKIWRRKKLKETAYHVNDVAYDIARMYDLSAHGRSKMHIQYQIYFHI